jgi:hypothetical protein
MIFGCLSVFALAMPLQTFAQFADTTAVEKYLGNSGIAGTNDPSKTGSALLDTIKKFINWMLGMLATIALVICLYAGFLMTTAAGDDGKYKKGMTILKQAAIGLVIIGLSW